MALRNEVVIKIIAFFAWGLQRNTKKLKFNVNQNENENEKEKRNGGSDLPGGRVAPPSQVPPLAFLFSFSF